MSRYDIFRRRIAPIAFILAIALLAHETCNQQQRLRATIVLDLGEAAQRVRHLSAEVWVGDELIAQLQRNAVPGVPFGPVELAVGMPADEGEVRIDVDLGDGRKQLTRQIYVAEDGTRVTVPLGAELR
ncbi:MAG: hypothetical protein AB7L28_12020 [Kofleriaceae bacterium]